MDIRIITPGRVPPHLLDGLADLLVDAARPDGVLAPTRFLIKRL